MALFHSSHVLAGFNLWDKTTIEENTVETPLPSSEFHIMTSDSIESKSSLLDVDTSLKASFLSGLIEVGGSAKYLNDQKKFKNQSRVTFQYKATTNVKQLSMTPLRAMDTQQTDLIEKGLATHVVTGIQYGANAFFVFDSEKLDASSVQNIQGSMEAVIKKIPSFNIDGHVDIKLTDEEKVLTNKFSCKFYGDFILENIPTTFEDAVKTYVELPKIPGENGEHAAPLKVWLMPLKNLDFRCAQLKSEIIVTEISVVLVRKAEDALEGIREIEMRCNDSLADRVSECFPQICKMLSSFQKLCNYYTSALQQDIKRTLLSIREGKEDESSLENLLKDRDRSPFSQEKLSKWMDHKEREISVIRSCVDMMEGINTKIVKNQSELDREVLNQSVENTLCFVFTSVESADPCLDAMTNYLDCPKSTSTNEDHWYFSDEVTSKMREKVKAFHDVVKTMKNSSSVCFLATTTTNIKFEGATIYHYKEGKLVTDDFSPAGGNLPTGCFPKPDIPSVESITDRGALLHCFTLWDTTTLQENTVETSQRSSDFHIMTSDSIESKSSLLSVDASLKASFLGGLIEVGGSAKYLNDQKKFKNQSRVTLQYKATTNFKQLSLTPLETKNTQQTDVIAKSSATHVVTGIQYGANAFFVFDSEKLDASSVQNIQGSMEAVIKKIPSLDIEGKVDIKLTDEEKDLTKKFSCKFYGDFILESNPATFEEAVKIYVELPKLLGENGEHAAPLKVWLMPLKNFNSKAAELLSEISVGLVRTAGDALEGIRQIKMRCNDSLADKVSEDFPEIRKTLESFQKLCDNFTSALQQIMKKTFPAIREGKEDESSLEKFFEERDMSPFSQDKLSKWMDHMEREITVIRSCVDMMEGTNTKIVKNQSELDREVFDPE
eukprot:superscaffoldBa00004080_g18225